MAETYCYWLHSVDDEEHAAQAKTAPSYRAHVLRIPTAEATCMRDPNQYSSRVWLCFTPLQEWLDDMQLLDCVPLLTRVPDVGYRYSRGFYLFAK
jgi:hypothetical protein